MLVNFLLLQFVVFVGLNHFKLFKIANGISAGLRVVLDSGDRALIEKWSSGHQIKVWLAPFSRLILISKIFVLSILLNLGTWRVGGSNTGTIYDVAVIVMVVMGMWVVTIPRYCIQYHIFKIREMAGLMEYQDVRMPWIVGGSALVDMVLILIATKVLLNNTAFVWVIEALND